MGIERDLLADAISKLVIKYLEETDNGINRIVQTQAIVIIEEIQKTISDSSLDNSQALEQIIRIFEENKLPVGYRRNF